MPSIRLSLRAATGLVALALALPAAAQTVDLPPLPELPPMGDSAITATTAPEAAPLKAPMTAAEVNALPAEYRSLPVNEPVSTTTTGADGVETITRTRRIVNAAPAQTTSYQAAPAYPAAPVQYQPAAYPVAAYPQAVAAPMVLDRESWIAECERRTRGRGRDETGSIIGGLLGAIGGGVLGNRLWDSERLAGTLIGGGVGGLAGALIGSLFGGDNKDDLYDCESALSTYLDNYGQYGAPRVASRAIPAPVAYPSYPAYGYNPAPAPVYYQQPQTMVMVPVTTYQPQRVVVRENVREEAYEVPGAARVLPVAPPAPVRTAPPAPLPSPKMIKN
ncbi:MAG: glycine zipper 2TM domain-containing protein [Pseudomonadota bacterium]